MRSRRFALALVCLALASAPAALGQAARPDPKRAAQALYERYVKAIGGARALAGVLSRSVKGTLEYTGVDQHAIVQFETSWVAPDRLAQTMRAPFGVVTRVYDGERGVGVHPQTGRRDLNPSEVTEVMRDGALYQLFYLRGMYAGLASEGTQTVDGRRVEVIAATARDGKADRYHFDVSTAELVRVDAWEEGPQGVRSGEPYVAIYHLEDYRKVDGVRVPFRIRRVRPASESLYRFDEVRHNVRVDEALFALPKE
jgi:hypothetical protein